MSRADRQTRPGAARGRQRLALATAAHAQALLARPAALADRTVSVLFATGGAVTVLSALAADVPAGTSTAWMVAVALACAVAAVCCWATSVVRRFLDAVLLGGALLVSVAVAAAPSPVAALVLSNGYLLVLVAACLLLRAARARWHAGAVLASAVLAQLLHGLPVGVVASSALVVTAVAVALCTLAWLACTAGLDALTGLPNRRGLDPLLSAAVAASGRTGRPVALAAVDVDGFGALNEQLGWAAADELLLGVSRQLADHLPRGSQLARVGGDSFLVLLPDLGALAPEGGEGVEGVQRVVAVVDAALARLGHPASAGLAVHDPAHDLGEGTGDLVRRAGSALTHAKTHARGRCHAADPGSGSLARDLAAALGDPAANGLHVQLQPVVDVATGLVVGVEALARWSSPERGRVSPLEFVAAAEDSGLIGELGAFVARAACREVAPLRARWGSHVFLTVNASGQELVVPGYVEGLLTALDEERLPASVLVLEVTESVLDGGSPAAVAALHALRARGVRVAVDDFGAGYSCLTRLDEVPADFLKLDATLLATAPSSPRRRTLLATALHLARSLDLTAIAEGAETPEHAALLAELGCPLVQGFGYARPASSAALLAAGPSRPAASPTASPTDSSAARSA